MPVVDGPKTRARYSASWAARGVGWGEPLRPPARAARNSRSASGSGICCTLWVVVRRWRTKLLERRDHVFVQRVNEGVGISMVGRRERAGDHDVHLTVGEADERFPDVAGVRHAIGHDAVHGTPRSRENDSQAAAHEAANGAVASAVSFGKDEQRLFAAVQALDGGRQHGEFLARRRTLLGHEGKTRQPAERGDAGNAPPVAVTGEDDELRADDGVEGDGDVEQRLVVHHHDAALRGGWAPHGDADVRDGASESQGDAGVQFEPRAHDGVAMARDEQDGGPDDKTLAQPDEAAEVEQVDQEEQAAAQRTPQLDDTGVEAGARDKQFGAVGTQVEVTHGNTSRSADEWFERLRLRLQ